MKTKKKYKGDVEWFLLFCISPFVSMKSYRIYEDTGGLDDKFLYISTAFVLLFCVSAAKLDLFNIFRVIRKSPKFLLAGFKYLIKDYKAWYNTGERLTCDEEKNDD